MNVRASRRCEVENAKLLLLIVFLPLVLAARAIACFAAKSHQCIKTDGARRLENALRKARLRAYYAYQEAQARLDQRAHFTLVMPVEGDYPQAIPVAALLPVQDTYAALPALSVYDTFSLPEMDYSVEEMQKPAEFSTKLSSGYLSGGGRRRERLFSRSPFPLA